MKPRRVVVTIECETDRPLSDLRSPYTWSGLSQGRRLLVREIVQVQANVIQRGKA